MLGQSHTTAFMVLFLAVSSALGNIAAADEAAPMCPDMPEHRKVLEQGQLQLERAPRTHAGIRWRRIGDAVGYGAGCRKQANAARSSCTDIAKLKLVSFKDFDIAQCSADRSIDGVDFVASEKYYARMLEIQKKVRTRSDCR